MNPNKLSKLIYELYKIRGDHPYATTKTAQFMHRCFLYTGDEKATDIAVGIVEKVAYEMLDRDMEKALMSRICSLAARQRNWEKSMLEVGMDWRKL